MSQRKLVGRFTLLTLAALLFSANGIAQHRDDFVYNRIVQIKGHVTIVGQPDVIASGMYLVFQRDGCKDCLVATHTDIDGNYQIFVGRGRYKLIVRDGSREGEMTDSLPPDQPRYINATHIVGGETLDVRIVVRERLRSNAAPVHGPPRPRFVWHEYQAPLRCAEDRRART